MTRRLSNVLMLLACVAFTPLLTACGKSSPTAPDAAAAPEAQTELWTNVRFNYVVVHIDGDFVGNGEFEFRRGLNGSLTFTAVDDLGNGDVWNIDKSAGFVKGEGSEFKIFFEASEWDSDILGNKFRDPDMDKRSATKTHTVTDALNGQYSITLGNSDCKVQLYYTLNTKRYDVSN